ncbi:MAG: hypothetical protein HPY76_07120 [Anaerolineae bacterium]|nr:hypothetical protein [Anaerolineae bacterium]
MKVTEERMKILNMIQDGKLSADEGMRLLEALEGDTDSTVSSAGSEYQVFNRAGRFLRISVTDTNSGKVRVNVRLPIGVVMAGMKMGAKFSPEVQGLDLGVLNEFIRTGSTGKVIDVYDDDDSERVEVFVE